jgi:hypothetical protein
MEEPETRVRRLIPGMRAVLRLASLLVAVAGVQLFIFTGMTDQFFAWTIAPTETAAFLGAAYWAVSAVEFAASRQARWSRARITIPAVLLFSIATLVATLLHLDKFHLGPAYSFTAQAAAWAWIAVYVFVPIAMTALLVVQLREPGIDAPRRYPLPRWLRATLGIHAIVFLPIGIGLFVFPSSVLRAWPWMLTPLTAQAVAAWLVGMGIAAASAWRENDWERVGVATITYVTLGALELIALVRFANQLDWTSAGAWVYAGFLVTLLAVGLYGVRETGRLGIDLIGPG